MTTISKKTAVRTGVLVSHHRREWAAGMRWETPHGVVSRLVRSKISPDTHAIVAGRHAVAMHGYLTPGRLRRGVFSLAVAFQQTKGGNAWGIYRLSGDEDLWVFLAASSGQLSVMGDVTGTRAQVEAAAQNFLRFNDDDATEMRCAAAASEERHARWLTEGLSRAQLKRCRLRKRLTPVGVLLPLAGMSVLIAAGVYWHDAVQQKAEQAAALAAFRARQAMAPVKPLIPAHVAHPWGSQPTVADLLDHCWLARAPLFASVAGWRFTNGECVAAGLRLRYVATPGATVEEFSVRARQLLGHSAVFNLQEGGKNGDVFIPFSRKPTGKNTDEAVQGADAQLMRFISHLQRHNLSVTFNEVKLPVDAPGHARTAPRQDWREFTFTVNTRLQPELLLRDFDAAGLRLNSVSLTMSSRGQFDYTMKGSIYAQN
ncbi:type 4b pilus protein PilO2 [Erwinia psidii]|uniref:Pilus assembly protein n=1 Tax=Erwinia psidii TaxID=69224 RepID=A0A3N6TRP0_9GAMM|nr:type 4b pilus protein PilO2 [Erwinia psidii]MCX8957040.1 pilus assembly protein [Erwinia psidii]MCX8965298.1 pilus assembly protein [Erwinia psidii]RQM37902.1 pilus assembly protein [Erwinia psidii]